MGDGKRQGRKVIWIILGGVCGLAIAVYVGVFVLVSVESVSVRFVNDTDRSVLLPDCGPDLNGVDARSSEVINVFQPTAYCSIDVEGPSGSEVVGGCLKMPKPLENGAVVRISQATPNRRPCS